MNIDDGVIRQLQDHELPTEREIVLHEEELLRLKALADMPAEERPEFLLATNRAIRKAAKRARRRAR